MIGTRMLCMVAAFGSAACGGGMPVKSLTQSTSAPTKLQSILEHHGDMLVKEYHPVGLLTGEFGRRVRVEAVVVSNVWDSTRTIGLRLQTGEEGSEQTGVLDADEAAALLRATDDMTGRAPAMARDSLDYTEVTYTSRGGVQVGFYQQATKQTAFVQVGQLSTGATFFGPSQFSKLRGIVAAGVDKVKQLNAKAP